MGTIRSLISAAANDNMFLVYFEISTTFLYGECDEEIFMRQPGDYEDGTDRVCYMKKSLYRLKQTPWCWNKRYSEYLMKFGFKRSDADPYNFIQRKYYEICLVVLYVDDGCVASTIRIKLNASLRI